MHPQKNSGTSIKLALLQECCATDSMWDRDAKRRIVHTTMTQSLSMNATVTVLCEERGHVPLVVTVAISIASEAIYVTAKNTRMARFRAARCLLNTMGSTAGSRAGSHQMKNTKDRMEMAGAESHVRSLFQILR